MAGPHTHGARSDQAEARELPADAAQSLCACYEVARWLYAPSEVWTYLRGERKAPARAPEAAPAPPPAAERVRALLRFLRRRVEPSEAAAPVLAPERWRSPGEVLWQGSAGAAELTLCLWSAAPLFDLPPGRMVIGLRDGAPHAWVEWPELGLYADGVEGRCGALRDRPPGYAERLMIWPPLAPERARAERPAA